MCKTGGAGRGRGYNPQEGRERLRYRVIARVIKVTSCRLDACALVGATQA